MKLEFTVERVPLGLYVLAQFTRNARAFRGYPPGSLLLRNIERERAKKGSGWRIVATIQVLRDPNDPNPWPDPLHYPWSDWGEIPADATEVSSD